jgi:tRNA threonylcarbamoyladenosine biosynthesis protein TsaE
LSSRRGEKGRGGLRVVIEGARHESNSAAQTEALGADLARMLVPGDVVLIDGELGAGKTTFVRGAAHALGVTTPVTSPTFTIGQRYPAAAQSAAAQLAGAKPTTGPLAFVSHIDLYRLGSLRDEDPDLLADYIGADTITFVEWSDVGVEEISERGHIARRVKLIHAGGDRRIIEIT